MVKYLKQEILFVFNLNGKDQGIAYNVKIGDNINYKLAVSIHYKNHTVTLTKYEQILPN